MTSSVTQVERLDGEPLGGQLVRDPVVGGDRADALEERLERCGPVLLGSEQQSDQVVSRLRHLPLPLDGSGDPDPCSSVNRNGSKAASQ